jgi:hypothetical protein
MIREEPGLFSVEQAFAVIGFIRQNVDLVGLAEGCYPGLLGFLPKTITISPFGQVCCASALLDSRFILIPTKSCITKGT